MVGRKPVWLFILIAGFILMISCSGCSKTRIYEPMEYADNEQYKTYTLSEGDIHFSFEYPAIYETYGGGWLIGKATGQGVSFGISYEEQQPMVFYIIGYKFDKDVPDIDTVIKERLAYNQEQADYGMYKDYKLLDKNKVQVYGLNGIEYLCSYFDTQYLLPGKPFSANERIIFISNKEFVFMIFYISDVSLVDRANTEFEHILQTFKILD